MNKSYLDYSDFKEKTGLQGTTAVLFLLDEIEKMKEEKENEKQQRRSKTG